MASLTFRVTNECSGGNHYTLQISGDITKTIPIERSSVLNQEVDMETLCLTILKLWARGKTANQIRTSLGTGVTITI